MILLQTEDTSYVNFLIPLVLTILIVSLWVKTQLRRVREIEELAARHRLGTLGGSLPEGFPQQALEPQTHWWGGLKQMAIENLVGGWEGEDFLLVFDLIEGSGKRRTKRTIVARKVAHPDAGQPTIGLGLAMKKMGDWYVVTGGGIFNRGLLRASTIEKAWAALGDATKPEL